MEYRDSLQNPESLATLYAGMPALEGVTLREAAVQEDGPTLRLRFDLPSFPDTPPKRWHPSFNTAQVTLALFFVEDLEVRGFRTTNVGNLRLRREGDRVRVSFQGDGCAVSANALLARVDTIAGYANQGAEE
ncbi:MAG TPA: Imm50 family immunity protein [Deferrisomatales bacterium]|nr:Imm50 family immunity protein [Deferrisomatales bacterium]